MDKIQFNQYKFWNNNKCNIFLGLVRKEDAKQVSPTCANVVFTIFENFHALRGELVMNGTTLNQCKNMCLLNSTCLSSDWNRQTGQLWATISSIHLFMSKSLADPTGIVEDAHVLFFQFYAFFGGNGQNNKLASDLCGWCPPRKPWIRNNFSLLPFKV